MTSVLIAGGGGREHALAWLCSRSALRPSIICAPGNAGTALLGENVAVRADDPRGIASLARARAVDLVVLGPDAAAAAGVGDACREAGLVTFGPTAAAARVESSKVFAKRLMDEAGIPTAAWRSGGASEGRQLMAFVEELGGRCAVKADGLALGKGVSVCSAAGEAEGALRACFEERRFGKAGAEVIVEERLEGREVSVLALSDGERARLLPPACDYKRALDGDEGPNTGGMGAYAPPRDLDVDGLLAEADERAIRPALALLARRGTPFVGCLYAGLMLTKAGLRVLEFNARFGDPEAQVIAPLLAEDLLGLMLSCARGSVAPGRVRTTGGAALGLVAASAGYPGHCETGLPISGAGNLEPGILCFHGAVSSAEDGSLRTAGGRVLTIVATGGDVDEARNRAYAGIGRVSFPGMRIRSDIGASPVAVGGPG